MGPETAVVLHILVTNFSWFIFLLVVIYNSERAELVDSSIVRSNAGVTGFSERKGTRGCTGARQTLVDPALCSHSQPREIHRGTLARPVVCADTPETPSGHPTTLTFTMWPRFPLGVVIRRWLMHDAKPDVPSIYDGRDVQSQRLNLFRAATRERR